MSFPCIQRLLRRAFLLTVAAALPAAADEDLRFPVLLNMVHHNPGEPLFATDWDEPRLLGSLGYTGQVPKLEPQCGLAYDKAFPGMLRDPSEERVWIERKAHQVRLRMKNARDAGIPLFPFTDFLVIPKSLWDQHGEAMKVDGKLSIRSEMTRKVIIAQIDEFFRRYPDIAGITLRHGETYLHDTPFHRGTTPVNSPEEHAMLIQLLRDEICVKRDKALIYRTWDFGNLHTRLDWYLRASDPVEPHPKLIFSIKHVNYDFVRPLPFNSTLGHGKHQQIVEVSVNQAGLYGRCSHPYYIGKGVIEGWEEMDERKGLVDLLPDPRIRGVWIWCWGDGWVGPYIGNELWNNVNEYVIRQWTLDPTKSEEHYFNEYAAETLGLEGQGLRDFRRLNLLATDATFLGQQSIVSPVNHWWCRDHYLTAVNLDGQVKSGKAAECLAEKERAVAMWKEAEQLANRISLRDPRDTEFMRVSTSYGSIKYQVIEQLWRIQLLLAEEKVLGKALDVAAARAAVQAYEAAFQRWRELKRTHPSCPTLYLDHEAVHCGPPFRSVLNPLKKRLGVPGD